ncbi:Pro-kumamolisin, activation domain-containing protein [Bombardia bombarda]|uniref:Pro-kumamolisin, activation domain-containing protein n=1 Tax=Bombardia bombarda TaxID=252184 RepID=A0AA40C4U1_9PEZI|nr:Pro-kumamolisin, activation domain-containing protein [Bombardia bombarda]
MMRFLTVVFAFTGIGALESLVAFATPIVSGTGTAAGVSDRDTPVSEGRTQRRKVPRSHVIHERYEEAHVQGWVQRNRADPRARLPMRVGLRQSNLDLGHDLLMNISDPDSSSYGKHLTADEVTNLFAPPEEAVDAVQEWLVSSGIDKNRLSRSINKQWIQFDAAVEEAERLLFTDYYMFEHQGSGVKKVACSEYYLPHHVVPHIDYITPGIKLISTDFYGKKLIKRKNRRRQESNSQQEPANMKAKREVESDIAHIDIEEPYEDEKWFKITGTCSYEVTTECIRKQYQIDNGTKASPGNELGIFQSLSQHYSQWDLDMYWKYTAPFIPNGTHPELRAINGAYGPTENVFTAGFEADLDFEVSIPLVWPQKTVLWQTDDEWYETNQLRANTRYPGFFNTLFDAIDGSYCTLSAYGYTGNCDTDECRDPEYPNPWDSDEGYQGELMCGAYAPTNVLSISYSGFEHELPDNYLRRQCLEIMKLGLRGVTVIESSGDYGVGGRRLDPHAGCLGPDRDIYSPRLMSNCPYILSVGATVLVDDCRHKGKFVERATTSFASGGGFSNIFETPAWQAKHVKGYIDKANISSMGYVGGGGGKNALGSAVDGGGEEKGKVFNKAGRGYPDVAAIGDNYRIITAGYAQRVAGTSVAVPIWASVLTLVNEERLAMGKGVVGFVQPVLYQHPEVFNDITKGSNPGCGSAGFQVKEGWDPVTGLGTPIYPKLVELFKSLP